MDGFRNPSSTFTGSETAANLNSGNAKTVTVKAKWKSNCTENCSDLDLSINESVGFSYTGAVKGVTLKKAGYYKLEVWGAQGGKTNGGYGGYSYGSFSSSANTAIYVVVGGQGGTCQGPSQTCSGGYNGGGSAFGYSGGGSTAYLGGGGGATHIATRTGLLKNLSSYQSSVLIVAGGGGGGGNIGEGGSYCYKNGNGLGGVGGGYIGGTGTAVYSYSPGTGGNQNYGGTTDWYTGTSGTNASFGTGASVTSVSGRTDYVGGSGGGGGWYGGGAGGACGQPGGGGSGYIGNSLLLSAKGVTKQMYMYSTGCTADSSTATKTTCTSSTGHAVANAANTGNGYAKITYLGT